MSDEWKARPDRPVEAPLFHVPTGSVTFRAGARVESLETGELVVLESAVEHEVEALVESACVLTLAVRASGEG
jgi:quercetin dioxygenase-like cupin family protein